MTMKDDLVFLQEVLNLDVTFIARLEQCGYISPTIIVNRFGMGIRHIAESFSMMGPSHVLNTPTYQSTLNLVIFSREQLLNGKVLKHPSVK